MFIRLSYSREEVGDFERQSISGGQKAVRKVVRDEAVEEGKGDIVQTLISML